jgi:hypothetical protein
MLSAFEYSYLEPGRNTSRAVPPGAHASTATAAPKYVLTFIVGLRRVGLLRLAPSVLGRLLQQNMTR